MKTNNIVLQKKKTRTFEVSISFTLPSVEITIKSPLLGQLVPGYKIFQK